MKAFQVAQKKLEAVNMGLAINDDGEATSYQDQLTSMLYLYQELILLN